MKHPAFIRNLPWLAAVVFLAVVLFLWPRFVGGQGPDNSAPVFAHASMVIQRADGQSFPFSVEVAETPEQERYGLMFRHSLPDDAGMIFIYSPDQPVSMWMKNTYIPLDMLFVRHDGLIVKIITHAEPFDLTPLPSDEPVRGVIELTAGAVARDSLKTGDKVLFPAFSDRP